MAAKGSQARLPLVEALAGYVAGGKARFHVPGHKGRAGPDEPGGGERLPFSEAVARAAEWARRLEGLLPWDVTEVEGLDDLHAPAGAIAEAEALAAALWGAAETCFLVNGTSVGLMACLMAAGAARAVMVPRLVHRSVVAGLALSGAVPAFYPVEVDGCTGLALPPRPEAVKVALARARPAAAVFTHPTYHGLTGDLRACISAARVAGAATVIDEAHGPHFGFGPGFPAAALAAGADATVQSAHKTLGALTQASFLHLAGDARTPRIDRARVRAMLRLLQTTSPSYLLLASLDAARWAMAHGGPAAWERAAALAEEARAALCGGPVPVWEPAAGGVRADPTRLVLHAAAAGMTGWQLAARLRARGVEAETADAATALAVVTAADTPRTVGRLVDAVRDAGRGEPGDRDGSAPAGWTASDTRTLVGLLGELGRSWPAPAMTPREATLAARVAVPLAEAVGRIAAEAVSPYPPGAPVVFPGEPITAAAAEFLGLLRRAGGRAHGAVGDLDAVWVVHEAGTAGVSAGGPRTAGRAGAVCPGAP